MFVKYKFFKFFIFYINLYKPNLHFYIKNIFILTKYKKLLYF